MRDLTALEGLGVPTALLVPRDLELTARNAAEVLALTDQLVVYDTPLYGQTRDALRASVDRLADRLRAVLFTGRALEFSSGRTAGTGGTMAEGLAEA